MSSCKDLCRDQLPTLGKNDSDVPEMRVCPWPDPYRIGCSKMKGRRAAIFGQKKARIPDSSSCHPVRICPDSGSNFDLNRHFLGAFIENSSQNPGRRLQRDNLVGLEI